MTSWSPEEAAVLAAVPTLRLIAGTDPVDSPTGRTGADLGMVVVDGRLYVRSYQGRLLERALFWRRGSIRTGTIEREVTFSRYEGPTDVIDAAYQQKYGDHGGAITHPRTRQVTVRVEPQAQC
jgi:hypothetical protein